MNASPSSSSRIQLADQRYLDCGQGTLAHPVTGSPITTQVVELEGFGRIFEVYEYSDDTQGRMALILKGPEMLCELKAAAVLIGKLTRDGRPWVPQCSDPVWAEMAPALQRLQAIVAQAENR